MKYDTLYDAVGCLLRVDSDTQDIPYCIFSMRVTAGPRGADHSRAYRDFGVQFRSRCIQTRVLRRLELLQELKPAATIKEMKALKGRSNFAHFLYDEFAAEVPAAGKAPSSGLFLMEAGDEETTFPVPTRSE
jgi:hypothetical protein